VVLRDSRYSRLEEELFLRIRDGGFGGVRFGASEKAEQHVRTEILPGKRTWLKKMEINSGLILYQSKVFETLSTLRVD
jgi:hypothetical protein